ncbi:MAG: hypothetical protein RBT53_06005 [Azonexus sp.]|jgi:hypothetical protein|nr:hypothetical protein [Azonexus sp.]
MKLKYLTAAGLLAVGMVAHASEDNSVMVSQDGRILRAHGTPSSIQIGASAFDPMFDGHARSAANYRPDPRVVPATCRTVDMRGYLARAEIASPGRIEGVPYGPKIVGAWFEAADIAGREPDSLFFCMTQDGEQVFPAKVATFYPAYEYRVAAGGTQPKQGQIVTILDGDLVVGVVFWSRPEIESKYLSMHFDQ